MTVTFFTAREAAEAVKVARPVVDAACFSGALKATDLKPDSPRRSWRIVDVDLVEWVRAGCPTVLSSP